MSKMKWEHLPARTSISMGKADVEKLRTGGSRNFVLGMVTGACLVIFLQSTTTVEVTKPDKPVAPISTPTTKN